MCDEMRNRGSDRIRTTGISGVQDTRDGHALACGKMIYVYFIHSLQRYEIIQGSANGLFVAQL